MALIKPPKPELSEEDLRRYPRTFAGLCAQLNDDSPDIRRWAARDLVEHAEASVVLLSHLKIESDPKVREALLFGLTLTGDEIAVAGLVECLRSEDAMTRNEAIEAMKQLPDRIAPIMSELLNDNDSDVRIFAVNILESLRHSDVEKWLVQVLENDDHVNVISTAVDLLGEVGTEFGATAIESIRERFPMEPYLQFATDLALKRIRGF